MVSNSGAQRTFYGNASRNFRINRVSFAQRAANDAAAISSTLSTLPILAPDLFGEFAGRKNRIQNYCEQDDPTSYRHDREDQAASPRH